jgi:peptide/nickel transport system permease protein
MLGFILRRLLATGLVVLGAMTITFVVARVVPRNVAWIWAGFQGFKATPEVIEQIREEYHLNEPLVVQYGLYLKDLAQGRWGKSPVSGRNVADDIATYLPNTIELAVAGLLVAIVVGISLGVVSARRRNSLADHASRLLALIGVSAPTFWVGLFLQLVFYYSLGWVTDPGGRLSNAVLTTHPVTSVTGFLILDALITRNGTALWDALSHMVLPAVSLALPIVALLSRMTRASVLDALSQDYIRTARSKGVPELKVVYRHALRNAMLPTLTVLGLSLGWLLTGSIVTEVVFYWPGIGRYAVGAVMSFDFPAITAYTALAAVAFSVANLVTDISYAYLDPRVRYA